MIVAKPAYNASTSGARLWIGDVLSILYIDCDVTTILLIR